MVNFNRRPIEFDDQQCLYIERIANTNKVFSCTNGRPIHHFHATRNDPSADNIGDALPRLLTRWKADHDSTRGFGLLQNTNGDFRHHSKQTFRAGHQPQQIITFAIKMLAAKAQDFTSYQHHFDAKHVIGGEPIFQAMHATSILRNISAYRAGNLRGWIRRIVKTFMLNSLCNAEIRYPRLYDCNAIGIIDFENTIEAGHAEKHSISQRHRTAGQRCASSARHHANTIVMTIAQNV